MDTPQISANEAEPKKASTSHRAKLLIITLLVVIVGLICALMWCWFFYKGGHSADASPSPGATTATGPCKDGADNTLPAGFSFYENATLGYKFAYPTAWGAVTVTTPPIASETGNYVQGRFAAKANVWFGGNAIDYTVRGRDGIPTDLPGFLKAGGNFYTVELWKFTDGTSTETREVLHRIDMPYEEKQGCNIPALITHIDASEISSVGPADVARFTLQPTNAYYGVNIVVDKPTAADKADLDKVVASFELIP